MYEQTTKEFGKMNTCISKFGIRIGRRKYLNEYTPFGSLSLWIAGSLCVMCLHPPQQLSNYHLLVLLQIRDIYGMMGPSGVFLPLAMNPLGCLNRTSRGQEAVQSPLNDSCYKIVLGFP